MQSNKHGDIEMAIGFSQNFNLECNLLASLLRAYAENEALPRAAIRSLLGVGDNKAEAMITWLGKLQLRDNTSRRITDIGSILGTHDPYFEEDTTLWLLHYKLATNEEAEVWYWLTNRFLPNRSKFGFGDAVDFLVSLGIGKGDEQHLRSDVSIFFRSFVSETGLAKTKLIKVEGKANRNIARNIFYRNPPSGLSPYLVAYAIFDQRVRKSPNVATVTIDELLTQDGSVGKVFCLTRRRLEEILRLISSNQVGHLVDLSTAAGLDQVGLRFRGNPVEILKMNYESRSKRN